MIQLIPSWHGAATRPRITCHGQAELNRKSTEYVFKFRKMCRQPVLQIIRRMPGGFFLFLFFFGSNHLLVSTYADCINNSYRWSPHTDFDPISHRYLPIILNLHQECRYPYTASERQRMSDDGFNLFCEEEFNVAATTYESSIRREEEAVFTKLCK